MIWITDATGSITFMKPEWEQLTGQPVQEALGEGWLTKVQPEDRATVADKLRAANAEKEQLTMTYRLSFKPGGFEWVTTSVSPTHRPETGEFLGLNGTIDLLAKLEDGRSTTTKLAEFVDPSDASATPIETLADQIIAARVLAATAQEQVIVSILDMALLEIGFRLAQSRPKETDVV